MTPAGPPDPRQPRASSSTTAASPPWAWTSSPSTPAPPRRRSTTASAPRTGWSSPTSRSGHAAGRRTWTDGSSAAGPPGSRRALVVLDALEDWLAEADPWLRLRQRLRRAVGLQSPAATSDRTRGEGVDPRPLRPAGAPRRSSPARDPRPPARPGPRGRDRRADRGRVAARARRRAPGDARAAGGLTRRGRGRALVAQLLHARSSPRAAAPASPRCARRPAARTTPARPRGCGRRRPRRGCRAPAARAAAAASSRARRGG